MFLWPGYKEHKAIALWRHLLNAMHTAWQFSSKNHAMLNNVPFPPTSMRSCLGKLFRSYYIRLRMCAATASIDRIELHASLTNWMWDSRNRFVSSWQFRCFLGLITSKSAAIAFTGLSTQTSGGKLNLDRLLAYGRKINQHSWIWKKSSHEEGAHGGKLTVRKTCSEWPQC